MALLEVTDLRVSFDTPQGVVHAVRGLSFGVGEGRTLGIVGESGAGKSAGVQALLGLLPGARTGGRALFAGRDLLTAGEKELRRVRGGRIGMVFQDPLAGLHPLYPVGRQIAEAVRAHDPGIGRRRARERAIELLALAGVPDPARRAAAYPHRLSGGLRQRALIAMALAPGPRLLIADEPTAALDATVRAQILDLLRRLRDERGMALIVISHDLGVVAGLADEVLVMYGGKAAERGGRHPLYRRPQHPYTRGLLASVPSAALFAGGGGARLRPIPGPPPDPRDPQPGCAFRPRCPHALARCGEDPPLVPVAGDPAHLAACWLVRGPEGDGP
ncbi:ABC transporter ATP-binding protein [Spirillospora albida]|uniref:ABC transporter ATP-binding protein n=1 Tax=Spirillospora albida TaxID=58123 RepID=UPI0005626D11|nr:ABC transporter ATP-binding protein [Spirillospora albida]